MMRLSRIGKRLLFFRRRDADDDAVKLGIVGWGRGMVVVDVYEGKG